MDKKQLQQLWDELLIFGWVHDIQMQNFIARFLQQTKPGLLTDGKTNFESTVAVREYITSLGLNRCRDRMMYGELAFQAFRGPLRVFIGNRSPHLSGCLFSSKHNPRAILDSISNFKWTRKGPAHYRKKHNHNMNRPHIMMDHKIRMRDQDQNHNWKKVK